MKRKYAIFLLGTVLTLSLTGCQSSQTEDTDTKAPATAAADDSSADSAASEDQAAPETSEEPETEAVTEASLAPITPSDYLVSNAADYVRLGSYDNIPLEVTIYEITDDMIQSRIQEELEYSATEVEKKSAAQEDDIVYGTLSYSVKDEDDSDTMDDFFTTIGYEEYGADFDSHLIGLSAGDSTSFSIDYPEDDMMIDWAGKTVDFTLEVTSVCELQIPEYDETFLQEYTDYDSKEEYEDSVRIDLENEYDEISYSDAIDTLIGYALDRTEFTGYPQELFDSCKEETLEAYRMFVGDATEEEICEMFGISTEDLDADIVSTVNQQLLVSAYCLANDITVTEEEYISFLEENAPYYGEPDAASFETDYGRESLVWALYNSRFSDALYEKADITEVPYDPDEFETELFEPDELDISEVESESISKISADN